MQIARQSGLGKNVEGEKFAVVFAAVGVTAECAKFFMDEFEVRPLPAFFHCLYYPHYRLARWVRQQGGLLCQFGQ